MQEGVQTIHTMDTKWVLMMIIFIMNILIFYFFGVRWDERQERIEAKRRRKQRQLELEVEAMEKGIDVETLISSKNNHHSSSSSRHKRKRKLTKREHDKLNNLLK